MSQSNSRVLRYFKLFLSALKGEEHDYTSGSINKAIILLAIPMIAEMMMESLFAIVDVYFVSKVSTDAVATVGLTESVLFIIYSIAVGLSMAVTAIVARRIGEKEHKKASDAAFQAILLALCVGIPLAILGFIFAEDVLSLMGGNPELIAKGSGYAKTMYASTIVIILLFLLNAIFRGAGNASIAMRSLWLANGLNMILDPLLIFGYQFFPEMGVEGAAVATTIGRSIGVIYQLYHLLNGSALVRITIENIKIQMEVITEMLKVAAGGIAQFLIESASWIFLVRVVSMFGEEALAGYTIAFRIVVFTLLPSMGVANAAATLVGQNLGAKQPERAETSVWKTALYNALILSVVSIIFFAFAEPIVRQFSSDTVVLEIGGNALKIICLGYIFFAYGMVIGQAFNGAGDTQTPMWISLVVFWIIQIPLAYYFAVMLDWKTTGVFATISIAHTIYALVAIFFFKRGKWKLMQV